MILFVRKHSIMISILLLLALLVLLWLFQASGLLLGIIFLAVTFTIAGSIVIEKHRQLYEQASIPQQALIRRAIAEILGILLAMILAGLLASSVAEMATKYSNNDLTKFAVGIVIGILMGIGVGFLVRQAWKRFLIALPENEL